MSSRSALPSANDRSTDHVSIIIISNELAYYCCNISSQRHSYPKRPVLTSGAPSFLQPDTFIARYRSWEDGEAGYSGPCTRSRFFCKMAASLIVQSSKRIAAKRAGSRAQTHPHSVHTSAHICALAHALSARSSPREAVLLHWQNLRAGREKSKEHVMLPAD